jgi:ribonuclease E
MANSFSKLHQALRDLIEAYTELEEELDEKCSDDDEAFSNEMIEALETSIESAIEEQDSSTAFFATMLASLSEGLKQVDPSAFDEEEGEEADDDAEYDIDEESEYDIDDEEMDLDEDEDEDDEDEDDEDEDD